MVRLICNNVIEMYYLGLSHVAIYNRKVAIGGLVLLPLHYMLRFHTGFILSLI
jgi:hypothetical protein